MIYFEKGSGGITHCKTCRSPRDVALEMGETSHKKIALDLVKVGDTVPYDNTFYCLNCGNCEQVTGYVEVTEESKKASIAHLEKMKRLRSQLKGA